jgi:hypothetical protein
LSIEGSSFSLGSSIFIECNNGAKSREFIGKPRSERSQPAMKPVLYVERYRAEKYTAWTKKKKLQDTFGAWDIRSPCTFNRLSQREREGLESGFGSGRKEFK